MKDKSKQRLGNASAKKLDIPVPRSHPDYYKYYRQLRKENVDAAHDRYASNRDRRYAQWRAYAKRNNYKLIARNNLRKAEQLLRSPPWVDKEAIAEFYKNCPPGYHVDHIIPLRGKTVSGLHVLENLQYLPAKENLEKGNKFDSTVVT